MFSKIIATLITLAITVVPAVMGQATESENANGEPGALTVEMMVIRETSMATNRGQNLLGLEYIEDAIGRGDAGDEVYAALERLVLAGSQNRVVLRGQVINNFPDVRQEAARQLGVLGTEEARAVLLRATLVEREPMVLQEIINSLGAIDLEDNAQTISIVVWVASRFHRAPAPNNHVALATVNALEQLAERDGGLTYHHAFHYPFSVAEGPYVTFVRERAWEVIDGLRGSGDSEE